MAGVEDFMAGLRALGYEPEQRVDGFVTFDYEIEVGPLASRLIKLALQAPGDWPANPPSGPYVSPRLLPVNPDATPGHPHGAVHEAPQLGPEWQYWSRPVVASWPQTDRTVLAYLGHLRHLFDTLPDDLDALPDAA
jgi:hypothetical protein